MTTESIPIDALSPDPANVRLHAARNLSAIKASLQRFGQQKPLVVDANNIVRAGNGTLAAARELGWTHVQIVRTNLSKSEATAYAIADNRTAELATWDEPALTEQLSSLRDEGFELSDMGFSDKELTKLLGEESPDDSPADQPEKWLVLVTCKDEPDQTLFLQQMEAAGRDCRAIVG